VVDGGLADGTAPGRRRGRRGSLCKGPLMRLVRACGGRRVRACGCERCNRDNRDNRDSNSCLALCDTLCIK
jgi:hypothetical protein